MKNIDEVKLEEDLAYRFEYVSEFIGFSEEDIKVILGAKELLAPKVSGLVDAVYEQLYKYDCTWRHFVPKQHGYDGETPISLEELSPDHPQIKFRKKHLGRYLEKLVTGTYNEKMVSYLDMVGKIHTAKAGNKDIVVPLTQMSILMGFVSSAIISTIMGLDIAQEEKNKAITSFNKLLWLQQNLITRHYLK